MQNQVANTLSPINPKANQVSNQMDELSQVSYELNKMISELRERLSPILRERLEEAKNIATPPEEMLVQHASDIRDIRKDLSSSLIEIISIKSRLEI